MITEQDMKHTNIRYSITLNDGQLAYLSDGSQGVNRMMCLHSFLKMAALEQTTVTKSNFSAGISAGQFIASKVELGRLWNCDRKTATRIISEFNRMGILQSEPTNRTTVHTLRCLSVWFTDQGMVRNGFFVSNPTARTREQTSKQNSHVPPGGNAEPASGE